MLKAKTSNEIEWINKVYENTGGNVALIAWKAENVKGDTLLSL